MSSNNLGKRAPAAAPKTNKPEKKLKTGNSEGKPVVKQAARIKKYDEESEDISGSKKQQGVSKKAKKLDQSDLEILTEQFVELLEKSEHNLGLDLQQAAQTLRVEPRRFYDVTNVLEPVGELKKIRKGRFQLVKNKAREGLSEEQKWKQYQKLKELEAGEKREKELDDQISKLEALLNN